MSQKAFIGAVIVWSWPVLTTSEQNTVVPSLALLGCGTGWELDGSSIHPAITSTDVWAFIPSLQSVCVYFSISDYPNDGRDRLKKYPVYIQDTWIINYPIQPILLKYWASFLNTLNSFPSPFMHDLLPIPWLAQGNCDGSTANSLIQLWEADGKPGECGWAVAITKYGLVTHMIAENKFDKCIGH